MPHYDDLLIPNFIPDPEIFGFPAAAIHPVGEDPDHTGEVWADGLVMVLYQRTTEFATDIVAVSEPEDEPPQVMSAIRIFSDFSRQSLTDVPPLDNLRAFAEKFGMEMIIAGSKKRFFLREKLLIKNTIEPASMIQIVEPGDHHFFISGSIKKAGTSLDIAMAFCLDCTRYQQWLHSH
jgi:hypothetical protein